jgi:hypothetical protein
VSSIPTLRVEEAVVEASDPFDAIFPGPYRRALTSCASPQRPVSLAASNARDSLAPFSPLDVTGLPHALTPQRCAPGGQWLSDDAMSCVSAPTSHHCLGCWKTICLDDFSAISPSRPCFDYPRYSFSGPWTTAIENDCALYHCFAQETGGFWPIQ